MHISEGVLSPPVLVTGAALTAAGCAIGLKKLDYDRIPQVAILTSTFFVASLIHIPIGPSSVHLILNGLMGLLLGWPAFPAILIALFLQALLFQFGGITSLGVNAFNMAFPAIICSYLFAYAVRGGNNLISMGAAFACGFSGILLGSLMVAVSLVFTGNPFFGVAKVLVAAHLPVMAIEGLITLFSAGFLKKLKPELLEVAHGKR
ncbi:MAG: cobalt transporter CbiM [Proteobacteria bacterium]|nr:cobalt transporter CbiM [Pseudomonadota bacterium]